MRPLPSFQEPLSLVNWTPIYSGFWQIPLAKESRQLTTFITPFGCYAFNKLPFGISSAPEHYQKRMSQILEGLEGVVCLVDDILVVGCDQQHHDARLFEVLGRIHQAGVTLNSDKCFFSRSKISSLHCKK